MKEWGKGIISFFIQPRPTLFDLCAVLGVIGMGFVISDLKGLYFIFYSLLVLCIGFNYQVLKPMKAGSLTLITLTGLTSLFLHSFVISMKSITFAYLNVYLMMEGFMYIFCGSLLLYTLATKGKNLRLFIITLPISALWYIKYALRGGQMSVILAILAGFIAYLIYKRRYLVLGSLICVSLCLIIFMPYTYGTDKIHVIDWLCLKFRARPAGWWALCQLIWQHPFVGEGFNKFLGQDKNAVTIWNSTKTVVLNCMYRPNDYLNIAQLYGLPILIGIGLFIKDSIVRLKNSWMIAPFMAICILACVQITFFWPDKALVMLCSTATFYAEN